jgi:hypothetical protein
MRVSGEKLVPLGSRQRNVGAAAHRIVLGQRLLNQRRIRAAQFDHLFRQLSNTELVRIPQIHRSYESVFLLHHPDQPIDQIQATAEGSRLATASR